MIGTTSEEEYQIAESIRVLDDEREELTKRIQSLCLELKRARERREITEMDRLEPSSLEEIEYYLYDDGMIDGARRERREQFWESYGMACSRLGPDTRQSNIGLIGNADALNIDTMKVFLSKVFDVLKPERNGYQYISIHGTLFEQKALRVSIEDHVFQLVELNGDYTENEIVRSEFSSLDALIEHVVANEIPRLVTG